MTETINNHSVSLIAPEKSRELVNHESLWLANFTSKQTKRTYGVAFNEFCSVLGLTNSEAFREVSSPDIVVYREWLAEQGKSNRTIRGRLAAISSCYKFLLAHHVVRLNPVEGVLRPKVDEYTGETPVMTTDQVRLLLSQPNEATVQGARDLAILYLLFYTGSRVGALRTIRIKDFYMDKGLYVLKWKKKGGANQILPVNPKLQAALLHYLDKSDHRQDPDAPLFMAVKKGQNNGQALNVRTYTRIWDKYLSLAGLPSNLTPHSARATFATVLDELGVPIQDIQEALSHANITTTQTYIHKRKKLEDSAVFSVKY